MHSFLKNTKRIASHHAFQVRYISDCIYFTPTNVPSPNHKALGRLRVPLSKSPSHFGHYSSRVNRIYNEDRYSAFVLDLNQGKTDNKERTNDDPSNVTFNFTIYDGHGGDECSSFLSEKLSENIEKCDTNKAHADEVLKNYMKNVGGYWRRWYKNKDKNFMKMIDATHSKDGDSDDLSLRLPLAFLETDYEFFSTHDKSGSTCTSICLHTFHTPGGDRSKYYFDPRTVSKLTVAHVGDTKAILVDRNGIAHSLTSDHHPSSPIEADRLNKYSAAFMKDSFGEERFISLANTRAFGDLQFKQTGISAEPDISSFIIGDSDEIAKLDMAAKTVDKLGGDECFIALVTDGVTNYLTDQEIADLVMVNVNNRGVGKGNPQFSATEVVKFVEAIGGDDNATCCIIRLNGWGKWPIMDRTGELRQERLSDYTPRGDRYV